MAGLFTLKMPRPGQNAPEFAAASSAGGTVRLSELRGGYVVLVFYPGDDTPVCRAQLCALRDNWHALQQAGARVLGINPAGMERHRHFASAQDFPFPLLVDAGGNIAAAYGCRLPFGMVARTVFIVDPAGVIAFCSRGKPAVTELLEVIAAGSRPAEESVQEV